MERTELISIAACVPPAEGRVLFGNPALDRHYGELVSSLAGVPEEVAAVVVRWRGGRVPVGVPVGGTRVTAASGNRLIAAGRQIGVFRRTVDGGWGEDADHEMLVLVTSEGCVRSITREIEGLPAGAGEAARPIAVANSVP